MIYKEWVMELGLFILKNGKLEDGICILAIFEDLEGNLLMLKK